jgi:hypothetical protein
MFFTQLGWAAMYDAQDMLTQAIDQGQPFVFVAVNYRVAGFGFLPGKEILADGAANIGLLDQRMVSFYPLYLPQMAVTPPVNFADVD